MNPQTRKNKPGLNSLRDARPRSPHRHNWPFCTLHPAGNFYNPGYLACGFCQEGIRREGGLYPDGWKDFILVGVLQSEYLSERKTPLCRHVL